MTSSAHIAHSPHINRTHCFVVVYDRIELHQLQVQWTIPQLTKILISTSLDKIPS